MVEGRKIRACFRALCLLAGALLLSVGGYLGYLQISGNFSVVIPGEVYRSAQLTPDTIRLHAQHEGIKSILNLRGQRIGSAWYDSEAKAAKDSDIVLFDFMMSDKKELNQERVKQLVEVMRSAPKPLLIHCKAGADRTGLAAALYLAVITHQDEALAEKQLSLYYGHIPLPFIPQYAMNRTFYAAVDPR